MVRKFLPVAAALMALSTVPAAHARVAISSAAPAANSSVSKVTSVSMQFSQPVSASSVKAELIMTAMPGMANHPPMKMQATSALARDGKKLTLTPRRVLVKGSYRVTWTATEVGGQTTTGHYSFHVK